MNTYIEKVGHGFLIQHDGGLPFLKGALDDVFTELLLRYEGLSNQFTEDRYGSVFVSRGQIAQNDVDETQG